MAWLGAFWTRKIDKVAKQGFCRRFFGWCWTDLNKWVVPVGGLEPPHIAIPDFESEAMPIPNNT